jgi:hypothetical protein
MLSVKDDAPVVELAEATIEEIVVDTVAGA